jgi:hypothetical protein
VKKFLIFNGMRQRLRSKFVMLLEFAAESSGQRGYDAFRYFGAAPRRFDSVGLLAAVILKVIMEPLCAQGAN